MEKCKRMKKQLCMSKSWIYSWQWKSSIPRQQYCRLENFAMNTDIDTIGSTVKKKPFHSKRYSNSVKRKRRPNRGSRFISEFFLKLDFFKHPWHFQGRRMTIPSLPQIRLFHHPWHFQLRFTVQIAFRQLCQVSRGKNGETRTLLKCQKSCWPNQPKTSRK